MKRLGYLFFLVIGLGGQLVYANDFVLAYSADKKVMSTFPRRAEQIDENVIDKIVVDNSETCFGHRASEDGTFIVLGTYKNDDKSKVIVRVYPLLGNGLFGKRDLKSRKNKNPELLFEKVVANPLITDDDTPEFITPDSIAVFECDGGYKMELCGGIDDEGYQWQEVDLSAQEEQDTPDEKNKLKFSFIKPLMIFTGLAAFAAGGYAAYEFYLKDKFFKKPKKKKKKKKKKPEVINPELEPEVQEPSEVDQHIEADLQENEEETFDLDDFEDSEDEFLDDENDESYDEDDDFEDLDDEEEAEDL